MDDNFINESSHDLMVMPYTTDVFTIYTPLREIIVFKFLHSWVVYWRHGGYINMIILWDDNGLRKHENIINNKENDGRWKPWCPLITPLMFN